MTTANPKSAQKEIEAIYPLAPSQQGMLLETLAASRPGVHVEQFILSLTGDLQVDAFRAAWQAVVQRHASLRTAFVWKGQSEPRQVVLKQVQIPLEQQDWRDRTPSDQQASLEAYLQADRLQGFTLTKAPLLRLALFQLGDRDYRCVWTFHHILIDGWCFPLILKEVLEFYPALCRGESLYLRPARPYKDYITWLKQQDLTQAEAFWRQRNQGITQPTPLGLPSQEPAPPRPQRYGRLTDRLDAATTTALQSLVRQHRLTLNGVIQAAWALLLSRYSATSDIVFGTTVSGRPPDLEGVESMVGLLINTLPLRVQVDPEASLWPWLTQLQTQQLEQRDYEYCSAGQVHQWSQVPDSLPLYESILVFENYPVESFVLQGGSLTVDLRQTRVVGAQTHYALTLIAMPGPELEVALIYDGDRFDDAAIPQILRHLLGLLTAMTQQPHPDLESLRQTIPAAEIPQVRSPQHSTSQSQTTDSDFVAPRDSVELRLTQLWEQVLGISPLSVTRSFVELGGHSLLALRLLVAIEQAFGKSLPLSTLFQAPTIAQLATLIREDWTPQWDHLVPINPGGSRPPFFCIHEGFGEVFVYRYLAQHLGADQPFYGLQAQGLDGRLPPLERVEDMAYRYIQEIRSLQPAGPYFLGGFCMGGYIAYEMAQQLQRQGQQVALLALMDTQFYTGRERPASVRWQNFLRLGWRDRLIRVLRKPRVKVEELAIALKLRLCEFYRQRQWPLPPNLRQFYAHRTNLRVHRQAAIAYRPQPTTAPVTLLMTCDFASVQFPDYLDQWRTLAPTAFRCELVPGNHDLALQEPEVRTLAAQLQACLSATQTPSSV